MTGTAKKFDMMKYFRETRAEVKKVSWPSRKELLQHTEVVITSIILVGAALWVADFVFGKIYLLIMR